MKYDLSDFTSLKAMKNHPVSGQIDEVFRSVIKEERTMQKKIEQGEVNDPGELSLDDMGELDIGLSLSDEAPESAPQDDGMSLSLDEGDSLDLAEPDLAEQTESQVDTNFGEISLNDESEELSFDSGDDVALAESSDEELSLGEEDEGFSLGESDEDEGLSFDDSEGEDELSLSDEEDLEIPEPQEETIENIGELSFDDLGGLPEETPELPTESEDLSLGGLDLSGGDASELSLGGEEVPDLSLGGEDAPAEEGLSLNLSDEGGLSEADDLSEDALEKLKEIDAIMEFDASQVHTRPAPDLDNDQDSDLNEPLVSDDLDLGSLNFTSEQPEEEEVIAPPKEEKKKKKKEAGTEKVQVQSRDLGEDLKEISGAYSGEMERMQATIANLRGDREELLAKIQKLEDEKVLQSRQNLSLRAELDERKIELTIIRKKLNEEISELKDRLKLYDEKRLILEEKNRVLLQELDKAAQKNKIDVKKVQMRERELEQKLELLKADAETQIRNRDLKILELKRKIDAMEFDMESITLQEKRSVESRYELEDKLEKAIKTLRGAITALEDESDRSNALNTLKKNIDM